MTELEIEGLAETIERHALRVARPTPDDLIRVYSLLLQHARESVEIAGREEERIDWTDVPL